MSVNSIKLGTMIDNMRALGNRDSKDNLKRTLSRFNQNNLPGQQSQGL